MNDTAIAPPGSSRLRVLLAALISFLLIAAGAVIVPPAQAAGATVSPTVSSASASGISVQVQASGLPEVASVYAALIVKGTESGLTGNGGYAAFAVPFPAVQAGASSFALTAPVASLDRTERYEVLVWQQHSNPNETTIYGRGDVAISGAQWDAVFGPLPTDPGETDPGQTDPGQTDPGQTDPGETDPGQTDPGQTDPGQTDPGQTDPGETDPGQTDPGETAPGQTDPGQTDPGETDPGQTDPGETDPGQTDPGQTDPGETTPEPVAAVSVAVKSASKDTGLTVTAVGTNLGAIAGAYVALIEAGTEAEVTAGGGFLAMQYVRGITGGAFSVDLTVAADALDKTKRYEVIAWQQHTMPNSGTIYARSTVAITGEQWAALQPAPPSAAIQVFLADGVTPAAGAALKAGDKIVVRGTGYDPTANVGGRGVPIPSNLPQGTYVVFGNFGANWKPSAGAASANRSVGTQAWALAEGVLNQVPSQYQGAIRAQWVDISLDGSFQVTLTLKDSPAAPGSYGVYTYAAGGVSNAEQERAVALNYRNTPTLTSTVKAATAEDGLTVTAAASKLGDITGAYVALIEAGTEAEVTAGGGFLAMQYVRGITGGAFSVDLTVAADVLDKTKRYEVIAWQQHTMPNASTIYNRSTVSITAEQWAVLQPAPGPSITAPVKTATAKDGLTVTATASNLDGITGAYVALIEAGTEADVTAGGGFLAMQYVRSIGLGAFAVDLTTAASTLDKTKAYEVIVWQQHTMPNADTIYARGAVTITADQWKTLRGEKPVDPKPPVTPTKPPATVPGGSLRWAISSSFSDYITGPIAQGAIEVSGGATRSGGQFQFGQTVGGDFDAKSGLGSVVYRGSVRFTGHHGVLDVSVASPVIRITSSTSATLYVSSGGSQVPFATLDLARATRITANGAVTYTAAPASLTDAGRDRVLSGYATTLNPVSFTVGSVAAAPSGTTGTVAAAVVTPKAALPAAPPATDGIDIDEENLAALGSGQPATVSASGFQPNEKGVKVVVYSTPVLLDTVTADAAGRATWSGTLPASLADGAHTLTFQGSVNRGLAFTLARATAAIGQCTVEAATLKWGYKESFRTYIEGIAKGGWTLSDVAYQYPDFVWDEGTGSLDDAALTGLVTFGGSITFTGHDGALNTTLANARLELAGDTGYLVFDVTGTTQGGESVDQSGVRLAEFPLGDATVADGALSLDAIPTTLTEAGAAAFGTYAAGEALDPVTAVIPVDAECGVAVEEEPVGDSEPTAAVTAVTAPAEGEDPMVWPWIVGGLAVVALAAAGGVVIARSRRRETVETTEV